MTTQSPPLARHISVHSTEQISTHLQRIKFKSEDFTGYAKCDGGAHIKLFFPNPDQQAPDLPFRNSLGKITWPNGKKPITRTYTVRDFDEEQQLLVIDFVRHEDFGIAADWAKHASPGDLLGLAGPGGPARFKIDAEYWIFVGDLSAIPMIAASLEQLPKDAHGEVWIEIEDDSDQIHLNKPEHIKLHWCKGPHELNNNIRHSLQNLDWKNKDISVSLAGENSTVVELRKILRQNFQLPKSNLYAVPYWKQGHNEEAYHEERHQVMDAIE